LVAVPSIGRATEVTPRRAAPEADATRDLYERYARQIYSYCLHQLGNREEAEDATQSTFLNAFRGFKRGVDPEFESAWVYKIAQNVCLTRQRSSSRRRKVETPGDLEAMQDYVPAHQVDSDELIRLPEALDAMPEQQRRALLLREWQGLSYKEIGEELDLSQAAVETLLFRARRSLAAGLIEEQQPPKKAAGMAKRLGAGDLGSILSIVKSLVLTGGVKVATAVATVAATSVVAATPVTRHAVEDIVTPRPDKAPVHHVSAKAAAGTRAAQVGAPFSLVPARAAAAPAAQTAPLTAAGAKARRHKSALPASNSTAGAGPRVAHAPSTTEPSAAIAAPPAPAVDTAAPASAPAADPAPAAASPAPQPAPSQPAADKPKSDSGGNGDGQTPSPVAPPKKDDGVPTVAQPTAAVTPAVRANDRNLASNGEGKKNDDRKNAVKADKKDARQATPPTVITTTPADLTTPPTTPSTTTTGTTPTVTPPTTATTTATTTTTAAPVPVPPVVTTPAAQPAQSSRPAEGHKPDGRGDNGNGNGGNGRKK
jgi:RNA polymerase sigma factor (sigma-70 family)